MSIANAREIGTFYFENTDNMCYFLISRIFVPIKQYLKIKLLITSALTVLVNCLFKNRDFRFNSPKVEVMSV